MSIAGKNESQFGQKALEFEKKAILSKISQMSNLPTPGSSIMKVMLLLRDEDVSMPELIDAISKDQSLVARILKLINSGYYGLRKTIDSVDRAVNLLGILKVKQLVYSASIMDMFSKDEEDEWNHAYSASVLMSDIMEAHEIPAASNLPLTVLMHDIGKVILRRFSPKKFKLAHDMAVRDNIPCNVAEDSIIHINHAEAGGWLLERWQMTDDIFVPVTWHHEMEELPPEDYYVETALVQFVNLVDCFARGVTMARPSKKLMEAAGFEEIDYDYWVDYQKGVIAKIEEREDVLIGGGDDKKAPEPTSTDPIPAPEGIPAPETAPRMEPVYENNISEEVLRPAVPETPQKTMTKTSTRKISRSAVAHKITTATQKIDIDTIKPKKSFFANLFEAIIKFFKD